MSRERAPATWAEVIVHRVGFRRSPRVLQLVMTWLIVADELGREPTIEEYSNWWATPLATAYRDLGLFREALPMFSDPCEWIAEVGTVDFRTRVPARFVEGLA